MIRAEFLIKDRKIFGFRIEGHAKAGSYGNDVVCAAVSSGAYLVINTITDVIKAEAEAYAEDGLIGITIKSSEDAEKCRDILKGFEMHLNELKNQYPKNIKLIYGGCKNA